MCVLRLGVGGGGTDYYVLQCPNNYSNHCQLGRGWTGIHREEIIDLRSVTHILTPAALVTMVIVWTVVQAGYLWRSKECSQKKINQNIPLKKV